MYTMAISKSQTKKSTLLWSYFDYFAWVFFRAIIPRNNLILIKQVSWNGLYKYVSTKAVLVTVPTLIFVHMTVNADIAEIMKTLSNTGVYKGGAPQKKGKIK